MKFFCQQKRRGDKCASGFGARWLLAVLVISLSVLPVFSGSVRAQSQSIAPASLPPATVGAPYSVQLLTVGMPGSASYAWSVVSGTLPPGLFLDSATGLISGKPDVSGNFTFIVQVKGSAGAEMQQGFLIAVTVVPITFATSLLADATEGFPYTMQLVNGGTARRIPGL